MTDDDYFSVSRLRKNTVIRALKKLKLPKASTVLFDERLLIGTIQKREEDTFQPIKEEKSLFNYNSFFRTSEVINLYKSR